MKIKEYKFHKVANLLPLHKAEIEEMAKDIKKNGLLDPIILYQGKILDGRQRYLACKKIGKMPTYCELDSDIKDIVSFVISKNLKRRHLSLAEKAIVIGEAAALWEEMGKEAKERQGKRTDLTSRPPGLKVRQSRDELGKIAGISGRSAERGRNIVKKGIPELVESVKTETIPLTTGERIAKLPRKEQPEAVKKEKERRAERKQNPKQKGEREKKPSQSSTEGREGWAVPVVDKPQQKASLAAGETISNLTRSSLLELPKNNPHREKAFKRVISWLRERMKEI